LTLAVVAPGDCAVRVPNSGGVETPTVATVCGYVLFAHCSR
jgi:hypothetical protein